MSEVSTNLKIRILEENKNPIIKSDELNELNKVYEEYFNVNKKKQINKINQETDILYNDDAEKPLPPLPDNNIITKLMNSDNILPPNNLYNVKPDFIVSLNNIIKENTGEETNNDSIEVVKNIINNNFEVCYGRLVDLVQGTTYDLTNWTLLIIKTLKCVSFVKGLSAESQISLALKIIIFYLDNNTNISDEHLSFIKIQAKTLCWTIFEQQGIHKKSHHKNSKNMLKVQKRLDSNSKKTDIDMLPSPLQIVNRIINKLEINIKTRKHTPESLIQTLPSNIILIVGMINKYKHLTKSEKKNLIVQAIQTIINDNIPKQFKLNDNQKQELKLFKLSLPQIVETSIGIANGDADFTVDFNKPETIMKVSRFIYVLSLIFPCFGKKK